MPTTEWSSLKNHEGGLPSVSDARVDGSKAESPAKWVDHWRTPKLLPCQRGSSFPTSSRFTRTCPFLGLGVSFRLSSIKDRTNRRFKAHLPKWADRCNMFRLICFSVFTYYHERKTSCKGIPGWMECSCQTHYLTPDLDRLLDFPGVFKFEKFLKPTRS